MLKAVFRPEELVTLTDKVIIDSPTSHPDLAHLAPVEEPVEELTDIDEYTGPTADDLRREAEMFKAHWEKEKEGMIDLAKTEAEKIMQEARDLAQQEIQSGTAQSELLKKQAEADAQKIIEEANAKAAEMEKEVRQKLDDERKEAQEQGREQGREEGYAEGKAEVDRLIERTQTVLERAQDKRGEILAEAEQQIVDLVLLIARKVIKIISENQRNVIISNVIQSLRKIKSKGNVIIRVNMADLKLATEHKQEFISLMENVKSIQIVEDTTVDPGGCIIETEFGEIDARISSQLAELESKILEISPMKSMLNANVPLPQLRPQDLNDTASTNALLDSSEKGAEFTKDTIEALENAVREEASAGNYDKNDEEDDEAAAASKAALTASAALAALATMGLKGKRKGDQEFLAASRKKIDNEPPKSEEQTKGL